MKRKQGRSRHDDGNSEGDGDEYAKKVRAGPDICDDVLLIIFSRLTSRDAARCAALSKHHRHHISGMDFWLLHRSLSRLCPAPTSPTCRPSARRRTRPTSGGVRRRHSGPDRVLPGCMFLDFHLAGGARPGDDELRYSLIDRVHLHQRYVGTCDGVILMAPERFNGSAPIVLFNPAVAGSEVEVRMELPFLRGHGSYRVSGFGYGPSRRAHKLLLVSEEPTPRPAVSYHAKELLVYTLGAIPSAAANQQQHRSVLSESELDDAKVSSNSVCLDGKIYLLADHSRVLAFDVDDESVTTIGLPTAGGKHAASKHSKLIEVSGRLCVAEGDAAKLTLWLLAADLQWVLLCEFWCGGGPGTAAKLTGAWDCGGVLLLYFKHRCTKTAYLHLYDTRTNKALPKVTVPRTVAAEQDGSGLVVCWGYRPTLVSPESIVGAPPRQRGAGVLAALEPLVQRDVDTGRERTLEAVCFMNLLLYIMRKLPDNTEDVDREIKHKSLPFSLR